MPYSFVILGVFLLTNLFFSKRKNVLLCLGLFLLLLSYFYGEVSFKNVSVNFFVLFAIILILIGDLKLGKNKLKLLFPLVIINLSVYTVLIILNPYYLTEFNVFPLLIITLALGIVVIKSKNLMLLYVCIVSLLSEVMSAFVALKTFDYYTCFGENFLNYFSILLVSLSALCYLTKKAKIRRKNKFNIVLCERVELKDEK